MDQDSAQDFFLEVYDRYASDIYRFCVLKVSSAEVAEDLTQEVFMRFWQTLRDGEKAYNERALLYTIARNLVIDWYRKKKETSLDGLAEAGIDFPSEDHLHVEDKARSREVLAVMHQLDDASREALTLRYVEGFSPSDIAELTGESPNVISVRIHRAVKKVQDLIHANE